MAAAYAAFSNGGYYAEPYTINKVEYIDSKLLPK
jgi:membrane peptidoglycan carboxypeptidase